LICSLLCATCAFADSISYLPLNGPGGSWSISWSGIPNTDIGGATNLIAIEPGFYMDLGSNQNNGLLSWFIAGSVTDYAGPFNSLGSVLNLSNITLDPRTGQITAIFYAFGYLQPGKGGGRISGILHERLDMQNGTILGGYLTNMVSTAPEPATWLMMGTGILAVAILLRRQNHSRHFPSLLLSREHSQTEDLSLYATPTT
jgi:hypothetical protein